MCEQELGGLRAPHRRIVLVLVAAISAIPAARPCFAGSSIVWEQRDGPFLSRAVLWEGADFTEPNLRSFYAGFAAEMKPNRAWDVKVFLDRSDLTRELYGKFATDGDYDSWKNLYDKFGRSLLPMAEFLGYGDNAVMRLRDGAGVCSEVVLAGRNFLRMRDDGLVFEILESYYHRLPPNIRPSPGDQAMISVFVRASQFPSVGQARAFSKRLRGYFRQKRVIVAIRTDSYFLLDSGFPILYRFDERPAPPSREQYERVRTMYCFCEHAGILCGATPEGMKASDNMRNSQ